MLKKLTFGIGILLKMVFKEIEEKLKSNEHPGMICDNKKLMMRTLTLGLILLTTVLGFSQTDSSKPVRQTVDLMNMARFQEMKTSISDSTVFMSKVLPVPLQEVAPFLAYSLTHNRPNQAAEIQCKIRFSQNGKDWQEWIPLESDPHMEAGDDQWASELQFTDKENAYFQYRIKLERWEIFPSLNAELHLYSPGETPAIPDTTTTEQAIESRSCPCAPPDVQRRNDWCPTGDCPESANPGFTNATHLIVHHSAGANEAEDWAAVVRSIWDFHVNTRGWDDVGYNFLVDPNGVIYEGRGRDILGAHFCGSNTGTEGFCLMGTYTDIPPTDAALETLTRTLAWRACAENIKPTEFSFHAGSGRVLNHISGHRDGCATECPGQMTYDLLPDLREAVAVYIDNSCSALPGPTALAAERLTDSTAVLSWNYFGAQNIDILIERAPKKPENFQQVARVSTQFSEYEDSGLKAELDYYYRVRSISPTDTSLYSDPVIAGILVGTDDKFFNSQTVRLFPNPFRSDLTIQIENPVTGRLRGTLITSATGQRVREYVWDKRAVLFRKELQLEGLPAGLYLLNIQHAEGQASFKLVKQ